MHYIRYDVLYAYVLSRLQYWSRLVQHDEERLLKRLLNANDKGQAAARKKQAAELKKAEKLKKLELEQLKASTRANRLNWTKRLNSFNPLSPLKARTPQTQKNGLP